MAPVWGSAPAELVQELGLFLGSREWAAARLVCRHWRAHITASVQMLELDLERSPHRWSMVGSSVRRLFPCLRSVTLLVGTRVGAEAFTERMAELAFMVDLPELELRYVPMTYPRLGAALSDVRGVTELVRLKTLKLSGGPTPSVECLKAMSALRRLEELEVLPGDYGVLHSDLLPPNDGAESPVNYGLTDDHIGPIEALTKLTSLLIKVKPEAFSRHGLASLAALPNLQSLVVYDAELPSCTLQALERATRLTALQVGVCDVNSLAPLARLPALEDLYLDTCALDDVRQLPVAAGNAALSQLTGLYCVDQLFSSQEHLAAVGELTGLKELVLEGPARAIDPNAWAPPGAAPGLVQWAQQHHHQHHHHQQQQQHAAGGGGGGGHPAGGGSPGESGERAELDISVLSRLTALEVLQLDKREEGDGYDGVAFSITPRVMAQLAQGWGALHTLDLYNIGPSELPAEAIAEMPRLTALRSLSISGGHFHAAPGSPVRRLGWWQLPPRLTALGLAWFDLSDPGSEPWHADGERMAAHFGDLLSLRLQSCTLPRSLLPSCAPKLAETLHSLSLVDVDGTSVEELQCLSELTMLSTLRLLPRDHGIGGVDKLRELRIKQLKLRLSHLVRADLAALSRLTSLFVLTLVAPLLDDGEVLPEFESEVSVSEVELAVEGLPYCDLELEGDAASTDAPNA